MTINEAKKAIKTLKKQYTDDQIIIMFSSMYVNGEFTLDNLKGMFALLDYSLSEDLLKLPEKQIKQIIRQELKNITKK